TGEAAKLLERLPAFDIQPDQVRDRPQGATKVGQRVAAPPVADLAFTRPSGLELGPVDQRTLAGAVAGLLVGPTDRAVIRRAERQDGQAELKVAQGCAPARGPVHQALLVVGLNRRAETKVDAVVTAAYHTDVSSSGEILWPGLSNSERRVARGE